MVFGMGEKRVDEQLFLLVFPDNGLLLLSRFSVCGRDIFTWAVYSMEALTTKGGRPFYRQYRSGYLALHLGTTLLTDYLVLHSSFFSALFGLSECLFLHLWPFPEA
jgi:hypothetical protein